LGALFIFGADREKGLELPSAFRLPIKEQKMGSFRIILADDHVLFRQGLRKLIDGVGDLEVTGEAGSGQELLAIAGNTLAELVILDISMPDIRGIEALRIIKKECPLIKVLVLTMYKEYLQQALSAGAEGYLVKEDADRELFFAIEHIRQGRIYVSPRLRGVLSGNMPSPAEPLSAREMEV
jgi:DNA-binding NarL/FixJ family response regulator